ncbi:hypothetical protein ACH40E_34415 [Streptomyces acidicola]|uniref:hypothetical protein n=1 Tax=Streptomyces acidicola TaxID=2596892 RepID=UPI0037BD5E6D
MDLQGIGATASAAVALVGIPAAVLVGRWNARAIREQADAALTAAQDQARANQEHWRRQLRRDAYADFLKAAGEVIRIDIHNRQRSFNADDIDRLLDNLRSALDVISLEGPDELMILASRVHIRLRSLANYAISQAPYEQAQRIIHTAMADESSEQVADPSSPLNRARAAEAALGELSSAASWYGADEEPFENSRRRAHDILCATDLFTPDQREALLYRVSGHALLLAAMTAGEEDNEANPHVIAWRRWQRFISGEYVDLEAVAWRDWQRFVSAANAVLDGRPIPNDD